MNDEIAKVFCNEKSSPTWQIFIHNVLNNAPQSHLVLSISVVLCLVTNGCVLLLLLFVLCFFLRIYFILFIIDV